MADFPNSTIAPEIPNRAVSIMDELDKGLDFVRAASMAVLGSGLDRKELSALDRIIGAAEDALELVKEMLKKTSSTGAAADV
jgi:hypothetical protein